MSRDASAEAGGFSTLFWQHTKPKNSITHKKRSVILNPETL
jgi:hypothetical protein